MAEKKRSKRIYVMWGVALNSFARLRDSSPLPPSPVSLLFAGRRAVVRNRAPSGPGDRLAALPTRPLGKPVTLWAEIGGLASSRRGFLSLSHGHGRRSNGSSCRPWLSGRQPGRPGGKAWRDRDRPGCQAGARGFDCPGAPG